MIDLRAARESRGLTLRALAALLGVSSPFIHDVENGRRGISGRLLGPLAVALGLSPLDLALAQVKAGVVRVDASHASEKTQRAIAVLMTEAAMRPDEAD